MPSNRLHMVQICLRDFLWLERYRRIDRKDDRCKRFVGLQVREVWP